MARRLHSLNLRAIFCLAQGTIVNFVYSIRIGKAVQLNPYLLASLVMVMVTARFLARKQ